MQCQQPGCAHGVYRAIHVVAEGEGEKLTILGSTCFAKRFGRADALGQARYGGGQGRALTAAERQLLVDNTASLLALLEQERVAHEQAALEKLNAMRAMLGVRQCAVAAVPQVANGTQLYGIPWTWAKPLSSIAYFKMSDGTAWVRVRHKNNEDILMPWPPFEGWDEALPARIGVPDLELGGLRPPNIVESIDYLKRQARSMQVGIWKEVVGGNWQ